MELGANLTVGIEAERGCMPRRWARRRKGTSGDGRCLISAAVKKMLERGCPHPRDVKRNELADEGIRAPTNAGRTFWRAEFSDTLANVILDGRGPFERHRPMGTPVLPEKLEARQLERFQSGGADFFYPQMVLLPTDLQSAWSAPYGHVRPFVHTEANGMLFVAVGT